MNEEYRRLKQKYDDISKQIAILYAEQRDIRDLMEKVCPHENVIKVETDPFLVDFGIEDDEPKNKCTDCFRYFTDKELDELNITYRIKS